MAIITRYYLKHSVSGEYLLGFYGIGNKIETTDDITRAKYFETEAEVGYQMQFLPAVFQIVQHEYQTE